MYATRWIKEQELHRGDEAISPCQIGLLITKMMIVIRNILLNPY